MKPCKTSQAGDRQNMSPMLSSQNNPLAVSGKCSLISAVLRDVSLIHVSCVRIPRLLLEAPVLELPYPEIALNTPESHPTAAGIMTRLAVNPGRSYKRLSGAMVFIKSKPNS